MVTTGARLALAFALATLVATVVVPFAGGARLDTRWHLTASGTKLSGTYTNTTASVVNGFAVGTALKTKNPIVSFMIAGQTCGLYKPYGSAYCYTNIAVKPGQTVRFSGETKTPVACRTRRLSARSESTCDDIVQMCDTADRGADNTCQDVTPQQGPSAPAAAAPTTKVGQAIASLEKTIAEEENALALLGKIAATTGQVPKKNAYDAGGALAHLNDAGNDLNAAKFDIMPSDDTLYRELLTTQHLTDAAYELIATGNAAKIRRAEALIESSLVDQRSVLDKLKALPH